MPITRDCILADTGGDEFWPRFAAFGKREKVRTVSARHKLRISHFDIGDETSRCDVRLVEFSICLPFFLVRALDGASRLGAAAVNPFRHRIAEGRMSLS